MQSGYILHVAIIILHTAITDNDYILAGVFRIKQITLHINWAPAFE